MLSGAVVIVVSLLYLFLLFGIAWYGDRLARTGRSLVSNPVVYSLSIAVYCTSWTFYGSVGRAASSGVEFLAIYLGPTLTFVAGWFVIRKIIRISKANRITSIADLIASRYGKSVVLGGVVTVIAVVGILPYITLQLKAISTSFAVLLGSPAGAVPATSLLQDTGLYVALIMAAFAILFGTRHIDASEHHQGLVTAIAFESVVKLVAFLAVGLFVTFGLFAGPGDIFARAEATPALRRLFTIDGLPAHTSWIALTVLAMGAIVVLPRQFQVVVVENVDERHLRTAMWLLPLYLLVINVFVLPIAFAGLLTFPAGNINADTFMLTIPLQQQLPSLALLAFLGGLSAATGMIIVETVALATMVSNHLVMPILIRMRQLYLFDRGDVTGVFLTIRRGTIIVVVLLGYAFERLIGESFTLVTIGLVSFVAAMQFVPAILAGIYWKGATKAGALSALVGGFLVWGYTLLLPSFARSGWIATDIIDHGPFGIGGLRPYALFGLEGLDPIAHATIWTMLVNAGLLVGVSVLTSQSMVERGQALRFVDVFRRGDAGQRTWRGRATVGDLSQLLARFLGADRAEAAAAHFARGSRRRIADDSPADSDMVAYAERQLAGAIGAASARIMVASVLREEMHDIDEVMHILDEASQLVVYARNIEAKSQELERATAELRAANERLKDLDRLKDDFVSTVSHELRTPLTSIRSFSEILRDNPDLDADQRQEFVGIIVQESERLSRLINDILDLAKMEAGTTDWVMSETEPRRVIEQAITSTSGLFAKAPYIAFEAHIADGLGPVRADADRLTQLLVNLISNAVKFSAKQDAWVRLKAWEETGFLRVDVSDNGIGIARDDQARIFERFQQAGNTLTDKPQGTGLGLPICRQILQRFGGAIWVDSEPGKGSVFSFRVPLAHAAGAPGLLSEQAAQ
ncbi:MAG TPA: sensor histidine kinase [Vineibacter sp.]|nr:sensor histidine kinase [Vineibacter sp.]